MNRCPALIAVIVIAPLGGCAAISVSDGDERSLPRPFELELRAIGRSGRVVYYTLDADGELSFGGGRDAVLRHAELVGRLSEQQRRSIWEIVHRHNLLEARGVSFADPQDVRYEVRVRAGSRRNRLDSVDRAVAGLAELDRALFDMQADMRHPDLFGPIERGIPESGGAVEER